MRMRQFTLPYLNQMILLVVGVGLGMCVPVVSHRRQIHTHDDHKCQEIKCANVQVQNASCLAPSWCNDATTVTKFHKCMPQNAVTCAESAQWGTTNCNQGICVPGGYECWYTLNHCVP